MIMLSGAEVTKITLENSVRRGSKSELLRAVAGVQFDKNNCGLWGLCNWMFARGDTAFNDYPPFDTPEGQHARAITLLFGAEVLADQPELYDCWIR